MNVVDTSFVPPKTGRRDEHDVVLHGELDVVRQHRLVQLHRQAGDDVAALVVLREQDEVGRVAAVDDGLHRRRAGDAGQLAAEVAGGVHLRRPELTEPGGEAVGLADDERGDRSS